MGLIICPIEVVQIRELSDIVCVIMTAPSRFPQVV